MPTPEEHNNSLDYLLTHGWTSDQIQKEMEKNGFTIEQMAEALRAREARGDSTGPDKAEPSAAGLGVRVSIDTVKTALHNLGVTLRYNQLFKELEITGLPACYSKENAANVLPTYLSDYLRECGVKGVTAQSINACIAAVADQNRYNPIKEYLEGLTWDMTDRFAEVYRILGVTNPARQTYIWKWFVQCVALGLNDEEHPTGAEGILVLQGRQGLAKTSFFRLMSPFPRWFIEGAIIDMGNKDTIITALSGWVTELGELDETLKKDQSSLKAFITRPDDKLRMPYARQDSHTSRRTSFCGTVNRNDYLKDVTGTRRFWTVPVTNVNKKALFSLPAGWVDQLWAQTYQMYLSAPDCFRMTDQEVAELEANNAEFMEPLPYELEIKALFDHSLPFEEWEWWSAAKMADRLGAKRGDAQRVGRALSKCVVDLYSTQSTLFPDGGKRQLHGTQEYFIPVLP